VAKGYGLTEYQWDFGDGSPVEEGWIDDPYAIEARHTYVGDIGDKFVATLTVWGAFGWSASDTYTVQIYDGSIFGVQKDVAIDEGLWFQHKAAVRFRSAGQEMAVWERHSNPIGVNASVIQAFQVHGHRPGGDPWEDPYVEDVQAGLNAMLASSVLAPASTQSAGDPDSNGNGVGIGIYENYGHSIYESGLALMALASSGAPDRVAQTGPVDWVRGRTYEGIVRDMADWFAWGQNDEGASGYEDWARGGWRYQPNSGDSDNSNTQFPVLGLAAAEENWDILIPEWVKLELLIWLGNTQNENGAFGYSGPDDMLNVGKTGAGIMDLVWAGSESGPVELAAQYIEQHWDDPADEINYGGNVGDYYAMYAVKKGSQLAGIANYGPHLWDYEYSAYLVASQQEDGRFDEDRSLGQYFGGWQPMSTAWALLILSPGLYDVLPVAIISPYQADGSAEWYEGSVTFDGSLSYHPDPDRWLVEYWWDFGDGSAEGGGVTPEHNYDDNGEYWVTLVVTDDVGASDTDILPLLVQNVPPSVDAEPDAVIYEGDSYSGSGSFTDPGLADTHSATVDYGDGAGPQPLALDGMTFALSHVYEEVGEYTVIVCVTDDDGGTGCDEVTITVENRLPEIQVEKGVVEPYVLTSGEEVEYTLTVRNASGATDPVVLESITDDPLGDILDPSNPDIVSTDCWLATIEPGDTFQCSFVAPVPAGDWGAHTDTVTVTAKDDEDTETTASDDAAVTLLPPSSVTDSMLCGFDRKSELDGQQFTLLFTPDLKDWPAYKLPASNPGQFYYNVFYVGDGPVDLEIELPYPFVTQGAMPVHAYTDVSVVDQGGVTCFVPDPESEVYVGDQQVEIKIYKPQAYGSMATLSLEGIPAPEGFVYVAIHLDYGLKGTTGYSQNADADALDVRSGKVLIPNLADHVFSFAGNELSDSQSIQNVNAFKRIPGIGGLVTTPDYSLLAGVEVRIYDPDGNEIGVVVTDEDGWYMFEHKHLGKPAQYRIEVPAYGLQATVRMRANSFAEVSFLVE
jgi:PKD repeat protein